MCATGTDMNTDVPISFEYDLVRRVSTCLNRDIKMGHTSHSATQASSRPVERFVSLKFDFEFLEVKSDASERGYDCRSGMLYF